MCEGERRWEAGPEARTQLGVPSASGRTPQLHSSTWIDNGFSAGREAGWKGHVLCLFLPPASRFKVNVFPIYIVFWKMQHVRSGKVEKEKQVNCNFSVHSVGGMTDVRGPKVQLHHTGVCK